MKILRTLLNVGSVIMIKLMVMLRDNCHVTGKYRGSAHKDCNVNVKLSYKIPAPFQNPKNYDWHLVMPELGKFNFQMNVIQNGLGK